MLKEAFCSFETAKLLDKAGFVPSMDCVVTIYNEKGESVGFEDKNTEYFYQAPTHQVAMQWLREKGVYISIDPFIAEGNAKYYEPLIITLTNPDWFNPLVKLKADFAFTPTYEEAVETTIKYALNYLITEDIDTVLKKELPKKTLSDELFNELIRLNRTQGIKFIKSNSDLSLKESAIYYDLYVQKQY